MANVQERLQALAELGYQVGVGAVDDAGEALSYRVIGFGLNTTLSVSEAEESLDSFEATHDERAEEETKPVEIREAEAEAAVAEVETAIQTKLETLTARIEASNLPAGVKSILEEIAQAALDR